MAYLKYIIFCLFLFAGCEKQMYYWECKSVIYGELYIDYVCSEDINYIDGYKNRIESFYDGQCVIECYLIDN